ncbi:hypothetical protein IFM89_017281 [Coptis chinensis]|uniref:SHSP domain-containing protein n=1 Tax=Coptis chinensis TaxID=261450 RepID=A0A835IB90_9MAGN|nr:hypothetical protein IFM89_017281 [Coptis chinensis]
MGSSVRDYEESTTAVNGERRILEVLLSDPDLYPGPEPTFSDGTTLSLSLCFFAQSIRKNCSIQEDALHFKIAVPGLGKEDVKVSVEDNLLIIKGEGPKEAEVDDEGAGKTYFRKFTFTTELCKGDQVKAEMKNGVLKVTVPKVEYDEIVVERVQESDANAVWLKCPVEDQKFPLAIIFLVYCPNLLNSCTIMQSIDWPYRAVFTSMEMESAIIEGTEKAVELGWKHIWIESDRQAAVCVFQNNSIHWKFRNEWLEILRKTTWINVTCSWMVANFSAEICAKEGCALAKGHKKWSNSRPVFDLKCVIRQPDYVR